MMRSPTKKTFISVIWIIAAFSACEPPTQLDDDAPPADELDTVASDAPDDALDVMVDNAVPTGDLDTAADTTQDAADTPADAAELDGSASCSPADCDDGNPCTLDQCDDSGGCQTVAQIAACDDGDPCTDADACSMGVCVGVVVDCADGNPCTTDSCGADSSCIYVPTRGPCSDGDACTEDDGCNQGLCAGMEVACDDGNSCTTDQCDMASGCVFLEHDGACDDDDVCTEQDVCSAGNCVGLAAVCNDDNPCTDDVCDPTTGCAFTTNAAECDDGSVCTSGDACTDGQCVGVSVVCSDDNPCTDDTCVAPSGCVFTANAAPCDDADPCTDGDSCGAETCQAGAMVCECTTDVECAAAEDGDLCNGTLVCDLSKLPYSCAVDPATLVTCQASVVVCQINGCDPAVGACNPSATPNGTLCVDVGIPESGICSAGACVAPTTPCDDGEPCTEDIYYEAVGCTHAWLPGCGGKPCGECPADLGFECSSTTGKPICYNAGTDEVWVAAGTFLLGCDETKNEYCHELELPMVRAWLPGYAIDVFPVTGLELLDCVDAGMCSTGNTTLPNHALAWDGDPQRAMNWLYPQSARSYCTWRGAELCNESEWEKAGKGGCASRGCAEHDDGCCQAATPVRPWGDEPAECKEALATGAEFHCLSSPGGTDVPGQKPSGASIYGAQDLIGTAVEWTRATPGYAVGWSYSALEFDEETGAAMLNNAMSPTSYTLRGHAFTATEYSQTTGEPVGVSFPSVHRRVEVLDPSIGPGRGFRCCRRDFAMETD